MRIVRRSSENDHPDANVIFNEDGRATVSGQVLSVAHSMGQQLQRQHAVVDRDIRLDNLSRNDSRELEIPVERKATDPNPRSAEGGRERRETEAAKRRHQRWRKIEEYRVELRASIAAYGGLDLGPVREPDWEGMERHRARSSVPDTVIRRDRELWRNRERGPPTFGYELSDRKLRHVGLRRHVRVA